jgi:bifunctional non-homologous end joining protein LigD
LKRLKLGSALIDGEVVVEQESGVSSFAGLQEALKAGRSDRMIFYIFDLLYLGGYDLTRAALIDRKTLLAGCVDDAPSGGSIRYSEHIEGNGEAMLPNACRLGLQASSPSARISRIAADGPRIGSRRTAPSARS